MSRIKGKSDLYEMDLLLDVNTDLYPMDVGACVMMLELDLRRLFQAGPNVQFPLCVCKQVGEKFLLALSKTLEKKGAAMSGHYDAVRL